ncbi:short-chain dehydrogenase/reductase family 16C member 6-like [Agrilus planipennis]|uniref:Short-chain dehydrogenase/reductase 3 n=1 Tax=Agrilus planipennis TaxID=224129 RepID=A0A1W4WER5_AGRPL|nr:short-chain dehydrogenase/reductase family 16C member 6-like [Agrilus planipennis]
MFLTLGQYFELFVILVALVLTAVFLKNIGRIVQIAGIVTITVANLIINIIFGLVAGRRRHRRHKKRLNDFNNNAPNGSTIEDIPEEQEVKNQETDEMSTLEWLSSYIINVITTAWECMVLLVLSAYYVTETLILSVTPTAFRSQKSLKHKVVVITGGAGGVGQELAVRLATIKAKVVIWDVNEKAIENAQERFKKENLQIYSYVVDVTNKKSVEKTADVVKYEVGPVDVLINNAGIVSGNTFMDLPDDMIEKTFKVNVISHYWTIKAFLKDMIHRGKGHIVTVGSLTGLLGTYKCCDYSATKFATVGLHESLLTELKTHGHDNIHMTLVCPYFINTGMFDGCKPKNMAMLQPKDVAKRIVTAIRLEEVFVTIPSFARFALPLKHYIPAKLAWAMMFRLIQGPQAMMGMKSHQEEFTHEIVQKESNGGTDYLQF